MLNSRDGYTQSSYQACLYQVSGVTKSMTYESGSGSCRHFSRAPRHTLVNRYGGMNLLASSWHAVFPYDQLLCCKFLTSIKTVPITYCRYRTNEKTGSSEER